MGREQTSIDDTGRVYLPVDTREEANLDIGDDVEVEASQDRVVLTKPATTSP